MYLMKMLVAVGALCAVALFIHGAGVPAMAKTEIIPGAGAKAPENAVEEIHSAFKKAEEAIREGDLKELMKFYSNGYEYHGLKKKDIRKIWEDLFGKHRRVETTHLLSNFVVKDDGKVKTAEVTCTGNLWATSKTTGKRQNIDSWFEEAHYLIFEDGAWRARGNAGEPSHLMQFGSAPHPLF